jgi:hypothetical protein
MDDYNSLVNNGCVFIPVTGYYSTVFNWRDIDEGQFYAADVNSDNKPYFMKYMDGFDIGSGNTSTGYANEYKVVRLVKQATGPMYP